MSEESPVPFHLPLMDRGNYLHVRDLAALIAAPGEDLRQVAQEARGLLNRGYLFPVGRDRNDARGALLFAPDAALVAAALRAATTDLGIAGKDRLHRIALALQSFTGTPPAPDEPRNPAAFILMTYAADRRAHGFGVELHASRRAETGKLALHAAVRHGENGFIGDGVVLVPEMHMPVAAAVVPLDDLAARIVTRLENRKAH